MGKLSTRQWRPPTQGNDPSATSWSGLGEILLDFLGGCGSSLQLEERQSPGDGGDQRPW